MPQNKGKGKSKSKRNGKEHIHTKRELQFKENEQQYAYVTKLLGNCYVQVKDINGIDFIAHIRGAFRKKVWIKVNDLVLISLREFEDKKADIIHVYNTDEVRCLISYGELPKEQDEFTSNFYNSSHIVEDVDENGTDNIDIDEI